MSAPAARLARKGNLLLVGILLTVSILLQQYVIAPLLPPLGQLGGLRPMIVFLDIPLPLPNIDWIPVSFLFVFFYGMVISPELVNRGPAPGNLLRKKIANALTGWWLLLICILAGGGLYYLVEGYLPRQVRNGIDSFGIRADITLPYPSGERIHLHGSMLLLLTTIFGFRLLLKKTALPPAVTIATQSARTPATTPLRTPATVHDQYLSPTPPPDCRLTTPPPIAVILPKPKPRIGSAHPCVAGVIEPAKA
ncbi:MAG TPA: hypothetical protein VNU70_02425 [Puia sp.]|jgi:hypothetical protein|nr:hypothetical protein [Puia sp.]